jgi:hypothetical protein
LEVQRRGVIPNLQSQNHKRQSCVYSSRYGSWSVCLICVITCFALKYAHDFHVLWVYVCIESQQPQDYKFFCKKMDQQRMFRQSPHKTRFIGIVAGKMWCQICSFCNLALQLRQTYLCSYHKFIWSMTAKKVRK